MPLHKQALDHNPTPPPSHTHTNTHTHTPTHTHTNTHSQHTHTHKNTHTHNPPILHQHTTQQHNNRAWPRYDIYLRKSEGEMTSGCSRTEPPESPDCDTPDLKAMAAAGELKERRTSQTSQLVPNSLTACAQLATCA